MGMVTRRIKKYSISEGDFRKNKIKKRIVSKFPREAILYSAWDELLGHSQLVTKTCFLKYEDLEEEKIAMPSSAKTNRINIKTIPDV